MASLQLYRLWTTEIIRQYEAHQGPLADSQVTRDVASIKAPERRLFKRAERLAEQHGLSSSQHQFNLLIKTLLVVLSLAAALSGVTVAIQLSPQPLGRFSLIEALASLVLVNAFFMLLWCFSLIPQRRASGIGQWLLTLGQQRIKQPQRALVVRAYGTVLARHQLLKPSFALLSHWLWLVLLLAACVTLLLRFVIYDYQFVWQTTLLSAQQIDTILSVFHIAPGWFGLAPPQVTYTLHDDLNTADTHRDTAIWLLSCIVLYAVLPRLLLLAGSLGWRARNVNRLGIDWSLPGFTELQQEWQRDSCYEVEAAPQSIVTQAPGIATNTISKSSSAAQPLSSVIVTLDWPEDAHQALAEHVALTQTTLYAANHQQQRTTLLHRVRQNSHRPMTLLLINANLSPDRGSLRFIQALAARTTLTIGIAVTSVESRAELWRVYLEANLAEPVVLMHSAAPNARASTLTSVAMELVSQWTG